MNEVSLTPKTTQGRLKLKALRSKRFRQCDNSEIVGEMTHHNEIMQVTFYLHQDHTESLTHLKYFLEELPYKALSIEITFPILDF